MTRRVPILLVLVALTAAACGFYEPPDTRLRKCVMLYNDGIRWGQWKQAAAFLPPDKREDFIERKEAQQDTTRVTEFEIRDVRYDSSNDTATVLVEYAWHRYPSLVVARGRVRQHWAFRANEWLMDSQEEVKPGEEEEAPAIGTPLDPF